MRLFALALLLLTLGATPALAQEAATHEFAGFSSSTFTGGAGVLAFNAACSEFGMDARMCNSLEIARTPSPPAASGEGWARPVVIGTGLGSTQTVDAVHPEETNPVTCAGWSTSAGTAGFVFSTSNGFATAGCNELLAVACCTPIPEPAFASIPGLIPWAAAFLGIGMAISAMLVPRVQRRQLGHGERLIGPGE
jgi:hypothetical protein